MGSFHRRFHIGPPEKALDIAHIPACPFSHAPPNPRNLLQGSDSFPRRRLASLFSFGSERVEILAASVFIFGQPGLEQTPEAKSAAHMQRALTVRTFVRLVRGKRIGKAKEIHLGKVKAGHQRERSLQHMSTKFRLEGAVPSEPEVRFGIERYPVSKHFYGNQGTKFPKMLIPRRRSSFYTIVSVTVSTS
jgi:hypothetical protein